MNLTKFWLVSKIAIWKWITLSQLIVPRLASACWIRIQRHFYGIVHNSVVAFPCFLESDALLATFHLEKQRAAVWRKVSAWCSPNNTEGVVWGSHYCLDSLSQIMKGKRAGERKARHHVWIHFHTHIHLHLCCCGPGVLCHTWTGLRFPPSLNGNNIGLRKETLYLL